MTTASLCTNCGDVSYPDDPGCECKTPPAPRNPLTPLQAAELSTARWSAVSLERIADALEELCTFKEEEARSRLAREERSQRHS